MDERKIRMMLTAVALAVLAVVAMYWLDYGAPKQIVPVTIVASRFYQQRGPEGRMVTTLQADDGRQWHYTQPGRTAYVIGARVQAELVRDRVRRLLPAAVDP